jgi:predicted GTPase
MTTNDVIGPAGRPHQPPGGGLTPERVIIMGAAGRDFHNFNTVFRDNPAYQVVAFTAAQIPNIAGRHYPASLAGRLYPDGVPIHPEERLAEMIAEQCVDWVYLSYSDLPHVEVMHVASTVLAAGANFGLLGPRETMLQAAVPVIAVCAVRTGAGKSPLSRHVARWLQARGHRVVAIRHPMPYGDLERQAVQRFACLDDLDAADATVEEREEYEPFVEAGVVVYAGVDYARIVRTAEPEADVIVWDGGNNDFPFVRPDLHVVVLDALRPGHELAYHPGETNFRMADVLVVAKVGSAPAEHVEAILANARTVRPTAPIVLADLDIVADGPELIVGKRVVVVEDGPTLTHGGMATGAGTVAAERFGADEIVDPRPHAVGSLAETFHAFPHLTRAIPAMGYSPSQLRDLEATLRAIPADAIIDATPANLDRLITLGTPIIDVRYEFRERGDTFRHLLEAFEHDVLRARTAIKLHRACSESP